MTKRNRMYLTEEVNQNNGIKQWLQGIIQENVLGKKKKRHKKENETQENWLKMILTKYILIKWWDFKVQKESFGQLHEREQVTYKVETPGWPLTSSWQHPALEFNRAPPTMSAKERKCDSRILFSAKLLIHYKGRRQHLWTHVGVWRLRPRFVGRMGHFFPFGDLES